MLLGKWSSMTCNNGHITVGILDDKNEIYKQCPKCKSSALKYKTPRLGAEKNSIGSPNLEALSNDGIEVTPFETNNESKSYIMSSLYEGLHTNCLLYTSDAADERSSVDLGGRRI